MTIRQAAPRDAAALAACAERTFPLACPPGSDPRDIRRFIDTELSIDRFSAYLSDPARTILCLEPEDVHPPALGVRGPLAGYSMLIRTQPSDPQVRAALTIHPSVELSKFYLDPAHHGSGTAGALMEATLRAAAGSGWPGIWLGVNQKNGRAIRFYARNGFRCAGTKTFRLGARIEDDYIFEQPLPAA